jgi:hypothetical protein
LSNVGELVHRHIELEVNPTVTVTGSVLSSHQHCRHGVLALWAFRPVTVARCNGPVFVGPAAGLALVGPAGLALNSLHWQSMFNRLLA